MMLTSLLPLYFLLPLAFAAPPAIQPGCQLAFSSLFSSGSGCPSGSVRLDSYSDNRARIIFFNMHAKIGDEYPESENYKTCDISLDVTFPKGCFFTGKFDVERKGRTSLTGDNISARGEFGTTMSGTNQRVSLFPIFR
jgi:hypothetical protein